MSLTPCRQCFRHVHEQDTQCPFCGTKLARRSQLVAVGTVVALGIGGIACSSESSSTLLYAGPPGYEAGQADADAQTYLDASTEDASEDAWDAWDASLDASSEVADALEDSADAIDEVELDAKEDG